MTKKWLPVLALTLSLIAPMVSAQNTFVLVFLEDAPLRHIKVAIDGKIVGVTDGKGMVQADVEAGPHKLYLIDDDDAIPVRFDMPADGEAEISAVFSRDIEVEPVVKKQIFKQGAIATGYIAGKVTSPSGMPIVNASVKVADLDITTQTNEDGLYTLEVPRGSHIVDVSVEGYTSPEASSIRVFADLGVYAGFKLFKQSLAETIDLPSSSFEEVVTLGVFNPTKGAENIERYATTVVTAIDADQLSRSGDSDLAAAIGRMTGLSVTEGKYANVRGLDGRYISSGFNGILMPSTDPMRRDIQLDLFPSNIVESIEVQKTFSADQPATSTGGSINVKTKGIPDEAVGSVSVSMGVNTETIGNDVLGYRDSNTEWLGYDNGLRDLHPGVLTGTDQALRLDICEENCDDSNATPRAQAMAYLLTFKPDYDVELVSANPSLGFDANFGDRLNYKDGEIGYYFAGSYDRDTNHRGDASLEDSSNLVGNYDRTKDTVSVSGYGVLGYEFDSGEVLSKTTLLRSTDDVTRETIGVDDEGNLREKYILEYVERQLLSQSFSGFKEFATTGFDSVIDWRLGYSETDRIEPDRRSYYFDTAGFRTTGLQRRWSDLNEASNDFGLDLTLSKDWGVNNYATFKVGGLVSEKDRNFDLYRFGVTAKDTSVLADASNGLEDILSIENIANDAFRLSIKTSDTDSYRSSENISALYLALSNEFGENWITDIGVRYEQFDQKILYPNAAESDNEIKVDAAYPSLNLTWRGLEDYQIRLGYSQTVSYPGLVERAQSQFYNPQTDDPVIGSSSLVESSIENFDIRVEHYFGEENRASLAFFRKNIDDPIEQGIPDATFEGTKYDNELFAVLDGIEIDFNTSLLDTDKHGLFVSGNLSYIDSAVSLKPGSKSRQGADSDGRSLIGQSEYLANLQLGYDHFPSNQKITFLINFFDDRISRLSRGEVDPVIEDGRTTIDLNYENIFSNKWSLKLKAKNLTNEPVSFSRDEDLIEHYETGMSVSASLSYEL